MEILIIVILFTTCIIGLILERYYLYKNKRKDSTKISFKEGLDLTELPVVTFNQEDKKLHFLLDTGSNISYIDKNILSEIKAEQLNVGSQTFGVEGNGIKTLHYKIEIGYKNQKFKEEFGAVDFSNAFNEIEKDSGVRLHGILGSKFFEKYKYIIDFKKLIAYR